MRIDPHPFADLFARIPKVACKGNCGRDRWNTCCGPIGCSMTEAVLLEQYDGKTCDWVDAGHGNVMMNLPAATGLTCPHLGLDGRCTAYEARPIICRVFGAVRALACPWGCKPDRWMSDAEVAELMLEASLRSALVVEEVNKVVDNAPGKT